jgi:spore germination protein KB
MEKVQINALQMFVLIIHFELGSAILIGPGSAAKQDAWITNLFGLAGGLLLFFVYYYLYKYYPDIPLTSYLQKITGKWVGSIIAFCYIVYFLYQASRILRDFGELLVSTIYNNTPLIVVNTCMILTILYGVHKGFEVIARVGELSFALIYGLAILGFLIIIFSGLIHLGNLQPVLENGLITALKEVIVGQTINFPFGEMIVFTMFLPYVNEQKKVLKVCLGGMLLSGINIMVIAVINISVLGADLLSRTPFPLLSTIRMIQFAGFIERLDSFFVLYLIIGGFFKISLYFYAAVIGTADLFKLKNYSNLNFLLCFMILFGSIVVASNYSEHSYEGGKIIPYFLHWPFQIIIPIILVIIAFFQNSKQKDVNLDL